MDTFVFYSYLSTALAYIFLFIFAWQPKNRDPLFVIAVAVSLLWVGSILVVSCQPSRSVADTFVFESLRNGAWFAYVLSLLSLQHSGNRYHFMRTAAFAYTLVFVIALILGLEAVDEWRFWLQDYLYNDPRFVLHVLIAIAGLILVEQLYRNAPPEQRWKLKFLCVGLGSLFTLDLVTYSKSLLFVQLDFRLWQSRGIINTLMAPLLGIAQQRLAQTSANLSTPRKTIFYSTILMGCGLYLILMAMAGYYVRQANAVWGETAQTLFIFLALLLLLLLFTSGKIRALAKIYFNKHFFHYSYDYRDEWLKLSKALANLTSLNELKQFSIKTLADLVESSGGGLWLKQESGGYYLSEQMNLGITQQALENLQTLQPDTPLLSYLVNKRWVIDFVELDYQPEVYNDIDLSAWRLPDNQVWLIIPLLRLNTLEAFVVLTKPRAVRKLNWEDHDLLKTVAMQLANALALSSVNEQLTRTRQFEAYHRLSAYLVHDLKNLVAQITLIVKNAEKHKHNPDFIDDAIDTLQNVAFKMRHIIDQLKQGKPVAAKIDAINLAEIIQDVIIQQVGQPKPQLIAAEPDCYISGDKIKLTAILGHLVQNAQDATAASGWVKLALSKTSQHAEIKVMDNGTGMDQHFIAERLFKPFDTTKGNAGMGIGAYEARDYILAQSGTLEVESQLGQGTTFIIQFPLLVNLG